MNTHYVGQVVHLTAPVFKDAAGAPIDPTVVKFEAKLQGDERRWSYVYGNSAQIVKLGVGSYRIDFKVPAPGWWAWRIAGEGNDVTEGAFYAKSQFAAAAPVGGLALEP